MTARTRQRSRAKRRTKGLSTTVSSTKKSKSTTTPFKPSPPRPLSTQTSVKRHKPHNSGPMLRKFPDISIYQAGFNSGNDHSHGHGQGHSHHSDLETTDATSATSPLSELSSPISSANTSEMEDNGRGEGWSHKGSNRAHSNMPSAKFPPTIISDSEEADLEVEHISEEARKRTLEEARRKREARLRRIIGHQFDLEILLKHRERRTIEQEMARVRTTIARLEHVILGQEGYAERTSSLSHENEANYDNYYSKQVVPVLSDSPAHKTRSTSLANNSLESKTAEHHPPICVSRRADGLLVKLVCPDCSRSNFTTAQGFLNHCRLAHGREFGSHSSAAAACGIELERQDEIGQKVQLAIKDRREMNNDKKKLENNSKGSPQQTMENNTPNNDNNIDDKDNSQTPDIDHLNEFIKRQKSPVDLINLAKNSHVHVPNAHILNDEELQQEFEVAKDRVISLKEQEAQVEKLYLDRQRGLPLPETPARTSFMKGKNKGKGCNNSSLLSPVPGELELSPISASTGEGQQPMPLELLSPMSKDISMAPISASPLTSPSPSPRLSATPFLLTSGSPPPPSTSSQRLRSLRDEGASIKKLNVPQQPQRPRQRQRRLPSDASPCRTRSKTRKTETSSENIPDIAVGNGRRKVMDKLSRFMPLSRF
ncbi:hypothetical protein NADFUDRAFT_48526 [Nadsonia fulvescens var. elongata DSM 6958]|uniref:AHC1-like C2H2 zinc-finger domain-containing protein n=1 Tax=Nadsonia fulvescens var. elongata DSM 6958 TaxID=857566 RepID=A0A1E3PSE8_9ASCO|nr:hypothetical protein NADFUDRAFT_48526 [Nadsonia fulvescens var. elongata DSM 6958]